MKFLILIFISSMAFGQQKQSEKIAAKIPAQIAGKFQSVALGDSGTKYLGISNSKKFATIQVEQDGYYGVTINMNVKNDHATTSVAFNMAASAYLGGNFNASDVLTDGGVQLGSCRAFSANITSIERTGCSTTLFSRLSVGDLVHIAGFNSDGQWRVESGHSTIFPIKDPEL